ncbi:MAG: oligosaccharide flippase family protein [Candidatus Dormibacteraceae bacterium]
MQATIVFTFGTRLVSLVRALILARLIGPTAFGLFAGIAAFTTLIALVADLGLTPFVVYRGRNSRAEAATVAAFSLASGLAGMAAVVALATPIAGFYHQTGARPIAVALSVTVLLAALVAAPSGVLRSEFRFSAIGAAQAGGEAAALGLAVGVALVGGGVWALVAAALVSPLIALLMLWKWSGIGRPKLGPGWRDIARAARSYGGPVVGGGIVWAVALQGDNMIVGRSLGTTMLGLYAFAYAYGTLPGAIVAAIVGPVAFPVFARVKDDLAMLHNHFLLFVRLASLVAIPAMALSVALAPVATIWLLGPRWAGAIQPLQLFLVVGTFRAIFPTDQTIRALGKTKWELITGMVAAPGTVVAALLGSLSGIFLVAALVSLVAISSSVWSVWIGARLMRVGMLQLLREPLPACLVGLGCGLAAWLATLIPGPAPVQLAAGFLAASALYVIVLRSDRVRGAAELKDLARSRSLRAEPT